MGLSSTPGRRSGKRLAAPGDLTTEKSAELVRRRQRHSRGALVRLKKCVSLLALTAALAAHPNIVAAQSASSASASTVTAPPSAQAQQPNVLVWMLDDVGFAQLSSFGGLVETPNIDRIAAMGLRFTNYHTAPICSASRAAFLTGRNPHSVHIGGHATAARNFPGYDARIPAAAGTIAENLAQAGYVTYALGKWDHLPNEDASPAGPFTYWPSGQGFQRFYGFLAADADNWNPTLIADTTPIATPADPSYHLSEDLADQAIAMVQSRQARREPQPFFMYWATGAAHAPHHAPQGWIEHYRGRFDIGWDRAREEILATQLRTGIVPPGATLAPIPEGMPSWDSLSREERRMFARQMETFAAALSHADAQFGRILDVLEASGELNNTIVIVTSDNGASAEGAAAGRYNEATVTGPAPTAEENLAFYDRWGGPATFPHYAYPWAVAGVTPFRYYKQVAHEGGTRVPLVISWPNGLAARGELRNQFAHVSDIAPTILDMAGVGLAEVVNNVRQSPMEGQSLAPTFAGAAARGHNRAQYVELYGNRGLWWDGWYLAATHRTRPWEMRTSQSFDEPWELYDLNNDPGQTTNLAVRYPQRVARMAALYEEQARRYNVAPMHNLTDTAADSARRAAQDFAARGGQWRYAGPVSNLPAQLAPPVQTRSFTMTAELDLPRDDVTGPLFAFGGQIGGMGFYLREGRPTFIVNQLDGDETIVAATRRVREGQSRIQLDVEKLPAAPGGATAYRIAIYVNGETVAASTINLSIPTFFGIPETFGVGHDQGSPVLENYRAGMLLQGDIRNVAFNFSTQDAGASGPGH